MNLPKGYTLKRLMTVEERTAQRDALHEGNSCLPSSKWEKMLGSENYFIYSLYNEERCEPEATILLADAEFAVTKRASCDYEPYITSKTLDQKPRVFNSRKVVCLEVLPKGTGVHSDRNLEAEASQLFASYYESLEVAQEYEEWDANSSSMRTAAAEFLRKRKEVNNAD